uniref:RNA helicase n=1 Tax=Cacopsylla melanoneura TaxID=428564 RepID=A0A8D8TQP8_9HEMI
MESTECWDNNFAYSISGSTSSYIQNGMSSNSAIPGQSSWQYNNYMDYPPNPSTACPDSMYPSVSETPINDTAAPPLYMQEDPDFVYKDYHELGDPDHMKQSRVLELSDELKQMTLDALKNVEKDFSFRDSSSYSSQNMKSTEKYQVNQGHLVIKGTSYAKQCSDSDLGMKYLISKLSRYGFHTHHCAEVLEHCQGNVDAAFELLMRKYFNLNAFTNDTKNDQYDLRGIRSEEFNCLYSIFEEQCETKVFDQLWIFHLELIYLQDQYMKAKSNKVQPQPKEKTKKRPHCKFFLSGKCRFGYNCAFAHTVETTNKPGLDSNDVLSKMYFDLEVRFPPGSQYPHEPPLVAILPNNQEFPKNVTLKITKRLMQEAETLALQKTPCCYALIDLANNPTEILKAISEDCTFPDADSPLLSSTSTSIRNRECNSDNEEDGVVTFDSAASSNQSQHREDIYKTNRINAHICERYKQSLNDPHFIKMLRIRQELPAWGVYSKILHLIRHNQVVVICGETGCGKSTQIPQFILDNFLENFSANKNNRNRNRNDCNDRINIVCTQPRQISAISLARRVADERLDKLGNVVGYQVRFESLISSHTRLSYCTTGYLLRKFEGDQTLSNLTHVIIDEVHERSEESDFLLMLLTEILPFRPDLKVILMSATMDAQMFAEYFGPNTPILTIPGRTFPVKSVFLEEVLEVTNYSIDEKSNNSKKMCKMATKELDDIDRELEFGPPTTEEPYDLTMDENLTLRQTLHRYREHSIKTSKTIYFMNNDKINYGLIKSTLVWIVSGDHDYPKTGSILVFLPGLHEIKTFFEELTEKTKMFSPEGGKFWVIPLHSSLTSEEQANVFRVPPHGVRKIILSTNIAESSVTIDDCVFVIDVGKMKENRFDSLRNIESLDSVWVSKANAKQRKGRAGRVLPGVCIHLYTSHRYEHLLQEREPELHRVSLEQVLLRIRTIPLFADRSFESVLERMVQPPKLENILTAATRLQYLEALNESYELTPLGKHLSKLPVDVRVGKLIIYGAVFFCLDSALTIAACVSFKPPFSASFNKREEMEFRRITFATGLSDPLTNLNAYKQWKKEAERSSYHGRQFANANYLSLSVLYTLGETKNQFLKYLAHIGFIPNTVKLPRCAGPDRVLEATGPELNKYGDNQKLLAGILCSALYPNIVTVTVPPSFCDYSIYGGSSYPRSVNADQLVFYTKKDGPVFLHPSSILKEVSRFPSPYIVFQEKIKTSKLFIRNCTMVPTLALILFCKGSVNVQKYLDTFVLSLDDDWIALTIKDNQIAELLVAVKKELFKLLDKKIKDPSVDLTKYKKGLKIIEAVVNLIDSSYI